MPVTYPPAAPSLSGDLLTISRFLNNPTLVARRLRTIAEQRFISDRLLTGRFVTTSGSVVYEQGESIYADRAPQGVQPGAEYPLTPISTGPAQVAKTVKWGEDALVTDESISRQLMSPVNRAFVKLVNQMVKTVDGVAMAAVTSAVTQSTAALASWAAGAPAQIMRDVARAKANIRALNQGYEPDLLVVDDLTYANIISDPSFAAFLPREWQGGSAPAITGMFPTVEGLTILPTPNGISGVALVADSSALGGMADENLAGPGYVNADGVGVQAKTIRQDETDEWRVRCRRVTVPVVVEPAAAWKITGVAA